MSTPDKYFQNLHEEMKSAREFWERVDRRHYEFFVYGHENPTRRERFSLSLTMLYRRIRWWFVRS